MTDSPSVRFDLARAARTGLPEAVFCEGKAPGHLRGLLERFAAPGAPAVLFTRLDSSVFASQTAEVVSAYNYDPLSRTAWNRTLPAHARGCAALVSAGTADLAVLSETGRTLEYLGWRTRRFADCGVAGLWRIEEAIADINACDVVILAAGLDAALASVVGGLTSRPLFAVPTSVGYGAARGGETALFSMLSSCAPGVAVLNIDNGYGAACAAARVLRALFPENPS